ncbi:hypothetical protein OE88DRAFT_1662273 [Heliocybe sulcata]|uniref:Uncharacterized protein n=1 Tax=Heliocybe sulcata TaxID=5364 RepID=A0A5C3N0T8_9AGAM|nr:hypothetical protein OE88DRAFT_1662273 [Heliocybe sulcata]
MGTVQENVKPHDDGSDAAEVLEDVKGDKGAQVPTQQKPAYTDVEPSIPSAEESRSAVTEDIEMSEEDTSGPSQTPAEEGTAAAYIDVEPNSTEPIQAVSQGPPTEDVEMAETEVVETNPAEAELLGEARADSDPEVTPVHEDSSREITDVLMVAPVLESQPTASPVADVHREDAISAPGAEPITLDILPHSIPSGNDREGYPYLAIYGGASSELGVTKTATVDKVEPSAAQIVDAALDAEEALKQAPDAPSDAAERADASAGSVTEPNPSPESHFVMLYSMKCLPGPRQHQHVLEFHLNVEQHGIVRQWSNRRSIPGNSFESGLCISLVCYRSTNLPLVDQDATARPRAEWPNTGTMWAVINESEGRELYLVPAFHIDKDGLVDISSYIKEGDNRMQVFYSGCSSDYTVVLQAHSPTPTQAQLERDRRRKDLERATYLTKLAEPIKLPNFNWDTGMFETA